MPDPQRRSTMWWAGVASVCALWLAQVSIPLLDRGDRAGPTNLVVLFLVLGVTCFAVATKGTMRAIAAVAVVALLGLVVEVVGTHTGFPFGTYAYTGALRPDFAGVPVAVVLAWAGMGLPAWAVACRLVKSVGGRIGVGALALMGWDLFLDPQMVAEGYWVWPGGGMYRGIPLSNFAGWFAAGVIVMTVLHIVLPDLASRSLASTYLLMSVMETLGFAAFFGDLTVALVGGVVCLPLAVAGVVGPAHLRLPRPQPTSAGAG